PGIGCPVIASLAWADAVLIVTAPTLSGQSDLRRVAALARHFGITAYVCVNKWDINHEIARAVEAECSTDGLRFMGRIPYDAAVPRSIVQGRPLVETGDGPAAAAVRKLWTTLAAELNAAD
ncbi:(4Fe-4S)-binding protein, partial [bacterium]|nr:(4Fe-4S)-binding protein [bacterium]